MQTPPRALWYANSSMLSFLSKNDSGLSCSVLAYCSAQRVYDSTFVCHAAACKWAPPAVRQERFVAPRISSLSTPAPGRQLLGTERTGQSQLRYGLNAVSLFYRAGVGGRVSGSSKSRMCCCWCSKRDGDVLPEPGLHQCRGSCRFTANVASRRQV